MSKIFIEGIRYDWDSIGWRFWEKHVRLNGDKDFYQFQDQNQVHEYFDTYPISVELQEKIIKYPFPIVYCYECNSREEVFEGTAESNFTEILDFFGIEYEYEGDDDA